MKGMVKVLTVYGGGCAGEHYPVGAEQPCYDAANDPEPPASTSARGHVGILPKSEPLTCTQSQKHIASHGQYGEEPLVFNCKYPVAAILKAVIRISSAFLRAGQFKVFRYERLINNSSDVLAVRAGWMVAGQRGMLQPNTDCSDAGKIWGRCNSIG
ncbi:hypothetical protein CEXT_550521 [Caerostris extrusa]|uniref:Uncharacterized protein n=1 Tax=Caerostris extrusa TaxID=172846 RepID=A0AAV4TK67_CAEEX|nr:hypothetical protein CEXT_550521 [Caerostris extrusa]